MNKRKTGNRYEQAAAELLEKKGFLILEKNYRCRLGEIDIIAIDKGTLVFAEVKYRKSDDSGFPEEAVSAQKKRRISRTAAYYCMEKDIKEDTDCRFDVIAIDKEEIRHYENAFLYSGSRYR